MDQLAMDTTLMPLTITGSPVMILNISFTRRLLCVAIQIVSGFRISSCWPMTIKLAGKRMSFVNGGRMIPWREYALFLWMVRISLAGKSKRLENALPKLFITIFAVCSWGFTCLGNTSGPFLSPLSKKCSSGSAYMEDSKLGIPCI